MTTQAETARYSERRLGIALLDIGRTSVGRVGLRRILLVPKWRDASQSAVGSMTESATETPLGIDGGSTRHRQVMHAQYITVHLRHGETIRHDHHQDNRQDHRASRPEDLPLHC